MALINKLTAIANGIRTLDDTTSKYTLDEMAGSVDEANAEIDTQAAKIAQLSTILDGKAGGGGSGGVETCTVTLTSYGNSISVLYTGYANGESRLQMLPMEGAGYTTDPYGTAERTITNVVKNSDILVFVADNLEVVITGGAETTPTFDDQFYDYTYTQIVSFRLSGDATVELV